MKMLPLFLVVLLALVAGIFAIGPPLEADSANSALTVCNACDTNDADADADKEPISPVTSDEMMIELLLDHELALLMNSDLLMLQPELALIMWKPQIGIGGSPNTGYIMEDAARQTLLATADNRDVIELYVTI